MTADDIVWQLYNKDQVDMAILDVFMTFDKVPHRLSNQTTTASWVIPEGGMIFSDKPTDL